MLTYEIDEHRLQWDGAAAARCRRRERGEKPRLSQSEVAAALGVSRQMVNMWERGRCAPRLDRLAILADLYRCEPSELVRAAPPPDKSRRSLDTVSRLR